MKIVEAKELTIIPPDGYKIDKENSTFEKIVFEKIKYEEWVNKIADICRDAAKYYYITSTPRLNMQACAQNCDSNSTRKPNYKIPCLHLAIFLAKKFTLIQELETFAWLMNDGWRPDWNDKSSDKWGLIVTPALDFRSVSNCNNLLFGITVKSQEIAIEMIRLFGDRITDIIMRPNNTVY